LKKVLVITYYWPPNGSSGVQRWLKFAKYLKEFNWEPVIYTPENPELISEDKSLLKDAEGLQVIKTPIWEPYSFYKRFTGQSKNASINTAFLKEKKVVSLPEKISVWIRGNFFFPDARKFWIKPSVRFLCEWLKNNPADAIVSTGPPHSMHLIAERVKQKTGLPWLADFRDPWTNIDFAGELMLTSIAKGIHEQMEMSVLKHADKIVVIGNEMKKEFEELLHSDKKISVITNGYDEDDLPVTNSTRDKKFSIVSVGALVKTRNPEVFWKALSHLTKENKSFAENVKVKIVGRMDYSVKESISHYELERFVSYMDYVPHEKVLSLLQAAQALLLPLNNTHNAKGIVTGKLFEYLAGRRPILCIGPQDGDAAAILNETHAGVVVDFNDEVKMRNVILQYYNLFLSGNLVSQSHDIEKYSRKNLTKKLSEVLDNLTNPKLPERMSSAQTSNPKL
jgi:glycosyltransferase involved in cell wall biosynthesis